MKYEGLQISTQSRPNAYRVAHRPRGDGNHAQARPLQPMSYERTNSDRVLFGNFPQVPTMDKSENYGGKTAQALGNIIMRSLKRLLLQWKMIIEDDVLFWLNGIV